MSLGAALGSFNALLAATYDGQRQALEKIGILVTNEVKTSFRPGSGNIYVRRGVAHRASAPGQPPAVDTGRYRASWQWQVEGAAYVDVGTNVEYGPMLEFGTSKMAPRPHLRPAVERSADAVKAIAVEEISKQQAAALAALGKTMRFR